MNIQARLARLAEERAELTIKIDKLRDALHLQQIIRSPHYHLMILQLGAMEVYRSVLDARLELFGEAE